MTDGELDEARLRAGELRKAADALESLGTVYTHDGHERTFVTLIAALTGAAMFTDCMARALAAYRTREQQARAWREEMRHYGCDHDAGVCDAPTAFFWQGDRVRGFFDGFDAIYAKEAAS